MLWNMPQRYSSATQWQLNVERSPASKSNTFSLETWWVRQSKAVTMPTDTSFMLQVQSACSESFHKPHSASQAHRTSRIAHPHLYNHRYWIEQVFSGTRGRTIGFQFSYSKAKFDYQSHKFKMAHDLTLVRGSSPVRVRQGLTLVRRQCSRPLQLREATDRRLLRANSVGATVPLRPNWDRSSSNTQGESQKRLHWGVGLWVWGCECTPCRCQQTWWEKFEWRNWIVLNWDEIHEVYD